MSKITFEREIACGRDRIQELLLNREFLRKFVMQQHPVGNQIDINIEESTSRTDWGVATEGIPGPFRGLVGETVPISLASASAPRERQPTMMAQYRWI